jgi:hypothetical protein
VLPASAGGIPASTVLLVPVVKENGVFDWTPTAET